MPWPLLPLESLLRVCRADPDLTEGPLAVVELLRELHNRRSLQGDEARGRLVVLVEAVDIGDGAEVDLSTTKLGTKRQR